MKFMFRIADVRKTQASAGKSVCAGGSHFALYGRSEEPLHSGWQLQLLQLRDGALPQPRRPVAGTLQAD